MLEDVTLRFTTFTTRCYFVLPSPHIQARHFPFQRGSFLRVLKCEILGEPRLPHLIEDQEELNHVWKNLAERMLGWEEMGGKGMSCRGCEEWKEACANTEPRSMGLILETLVPCFHQF